MDTATLKKRYEPKPSGQEVTYDRQLWQARFSPCGRQLVACAYDATIQRWDVSGEKILPLPPLSGHNGWVQCLGFDGPSQRLFTADSWGQLIAWPYLEEKPKPLWTLDLAHDGWIRALAVSPDGMFVATAGNDKVVKLWSAADGKLVKELPHPETIFSLCFHPQGKSLASGDLNGAIREWDVKAAKELRQLDAALLYQHDRIQECGGVRQLVFDANGTRLACAGQKTPGGGFATGVPCVLVFDWNSGKLLREMPMGGTQDGFAFDAAFHPEGFVMATSGAFPGKGHVWFWNPEDAQAFYQSTKMPNGRSLSLHPDGRRLAWTVSLSPNGNGRQLKDGQYPGGSAKIQLLEFPAAGEREASAS